MIYYPIPSHKQKMLKDFGGADYNLPVTDMLNTCVISLPIHTELNEEELKYITTNFLEIINELTK
jgi:UDP-2-acetamido-2-deoxy-ribo-hexuluronate aminotransferase